MPSDRDNRAMYHERRGHPGGERRPPAGTDAGSAGGHLGSSRDRGPSPDAGGGCGLLA